ncbi:InlB B-repeat-containing protein [Actinospica durhamensis]|uniref:InlB B-repeat-containing protein n=1 Tax=Actinospica durhamensis TaxID=1508375 RepID=A0A941EWN2_9ACTN|nr:InlB B-repeat-containing protein [Actinospica durhamensis]MBR7835309.1 InlB B-repeat-containing protein [Actinospica durhamensis]
MAYRPPLPAAPGRRLRRLTAVGLAAVLALTGETLALVQPASADATYATRDAVTPIVSYNFDADSGTTVVDGSGHGNNGTWSGTPAYASGVSGQALHVSAGKNFVTLPKVAGQTDGSGSFSFETWWYDNTETVDAPLVSNQNFASCANSGFSFYHLSGTYQQRSCFGVNGTKTYSTTDTTSIRSGWHYLAVVEDSSAHTYSYYVDGTLFSTTSTISGTTAANFDSGDPIRIAQDGTGAYSATDDALVDDFNFYNQAITGDQIAADYAATNPATHFQVTVTNDGHGTGTASVLAPSSGDSDTLIATPAPGYTFASWVPVTPSTLAIDGNGGFTDPGTPVTVEATFTPNTYTVSYDGNGADGGSTASQSMTYGQSATLSPNGFTDSGQQFIGWAATPTGTPAYTDGQSVSDLTTSNGGTVTLYARWAPAGSYTVSESGDAHVTVSSSADANNGWAAPGTTVTLTVTPATGYTSAWEVLSPAGLSIAADGSFTMPSANVSVQAVSSPDTYTVAFDGNGATGGSTANESLSYGQSAALTTNAYTRTGYAFLGWSTSPTGTATYTDGQSVSNLTAANGATVTLYAVWNRYRAVGDTVAPVVSYDFDNSTSTTATDSSGYGNDGTWNGTVTYAKTGVSGDAAHLSAGTSYIQLPKVAGETDGASSFSFSLWWGEYSETVDAPIVSNQNFASCNNAGISYYHVSGTSTTRACWGLTSGGTKEYLTTDPTALTGNWHYLSVVVDRSAQTVSYYVDGALFTTSTSAMMGSTTSLASGLPFMIGQDGTGVYAASSDALVDDFDFYDKAISAAQIANDYNATKPAATALPAESTVDLATPVSTLAKGFVSDTFHGAQVRVGGAVAQPLAGLWNGNAVTSYTEVSGDSWLTVSSAGVVSGTAPSSVPQHPGTITVRATDGTTTSTITVEVPVIAADDAPQLATATWNLWDAGTHVDGAQLKDLAVIANNGLEVIGVQEDGGTVAGALAKALGWYSYEGADGLGIVSAYPISSAGEVDATDSAPAVGVTVDVAGRSVRVWNAALDESAYGPTQACTSGSDAASLVAAEKGTTRYAQAQAITAEIQPDVMAADATPVVFLGDLASPSASDWTDANASPHCGVGAVDWPVPDLITGTGLTDSSAGTGNTWPIVSTDAGDPSPERVDYVDYAGADLHVLGSNTLVAGWPTSDSVASNAWTSDHAAVVTTFRIGDASTSTQSAPTVTVAHDRLTYQVGNGPAGDAILTAAIGATADPSDATVAVDSSDVDYSAVGSYTALVTATEDGYISDPVAVVVQVVPVATVQLTNSSVSVNGLGLNQAEVLDGLGAALNVDGVVNVDLSTVNKAVAGSYTVTVTGTDDYGFTAAAQATVVVATPDLPPVVTATVDPGTADGTAGWYVSSPSISASVTDDAGTTPVIEYRIGDGGWVPYSGALSVSEGSWTYQFRAVDDYDQVSDTVSVPIKVDTVAPYTTAATSAGASIIAPVTVTLSATDMSSGVAETQYQIGGGAWTTYTGPFTVTPAFSDQTVSYRSTDAAGNVETTRQLVIPAITPIAPAVSATGASVQYGTAAKVGVTVASPGLPADGTVSLTEGATARGTATLSGGTATFTLPVGLAVGTHTLTATYSGSDLLTSATRSLTVTVVLPQAWSAGTAYTAGAQVGYQGQMYLADWFAQGQVPGADPNGPWEQISMTEAGTAVWTASRIFNTGDVVVYGGATYQAAWYTRDQVPGDPTGPWEQIGAPDANGIAAWTASMVYNTGDKVDYQGVVYQAQWYSRDLTPGSGGGWKAIG